MIFNASSLPDHFAVAIEAHFFPPGPLPRQSVRISDDSGYLLTTVSNEQPNGNFVVRIEQLRSQPGNWISLTFDIDTPMSPQELGISEDSRKLGIGLVSLTFQECIGGTSAERRTARAVHQGAGGDLPEGVLTARPRRRKVHDE